MQKSNHLNELFKIVTLNRIFNVNLRGLHKIIYTLIFFEYFFFDQYSFITPQLFLYGEKCKHPGVFKFQGVTFIFNIRSDLRINNFCNSLHSFHYFSIRYIGCICICLTIVIPQFFETNIIQHIFNDFTPLSHNNF